MNFAIDKSKINSKVSLNSNLVFYICSSGGCGSTILFNYLKNFGKVYHIHDRYPPKKLCYIGKEHANPSENAELFNDINDVSEWFNGIQIPEKDLKNYRVIFIYRNPLDVIFSRFLGNGSINKANIPHLKHIKCINDGNITLLDILTTKYDLYGLENFFDNYTSKIERNYKIYCVKYESLFNNFSLFNKIIEIPDIKELYPTKVERKKRYYYRQELTKIYLPLLLKMSRMCPIEIIDSLTYENNDINDDECA